VLQQLLTKERGPSHPTKSKAWMDPFHVRICDIHRFHGGS